MESRHHSKADVQVDTFVLQLARRGKLSELFTFEKKMLIFGGDVSHRLFFFAAVCLQLLCLLFQVKVPMVCQYAHKLAFLIGESVHARPHDAQQELLYYL